MQPWASVAEATLDGRPGQAVLAGEASERFQIVGFQDVGDDGVEIETDLSAGRRRARDVGERHARAGNQLLLVLMNIRRKEEELLVRDGEAARLLPDPSFTQHNDLASGRELAADHRPLFERDSICRLHARA